MSARKSAKGSPPKPNLIRPDTAPVALILFVDIRGFTGWSQDNEVFARLGDFVSPFLNIVRGAFPPPIVIKPLGDGAMIVRVYSETLITPQQLLDETLEKIVMVNKQFSELCKSFARTVGHSADLQLGWGIVRGAEKAFKVKFVGSDDFVGSNMNKSARLCDVARPFGIVIDRDDFPDPPSHPELSFFPQTRRLNGITQDINIWATEEVASGFVTRERLRETPEVHVAGMCIDTNDKRKVRILIARRSPTRRLYPGLYEGCGGQLARSESFEAGVERHFRLEMRISVRVDREIHCFYEIREPDEPLIPGIRFLCHRVGDQEPESANHTEIRWVSEDELRNMDATLFIPKLKDDFLKLLDAYHKTKKPRSGY